MNLKRALAKNYVNFRGWSSKRKLVVIESDDWGSIRMPSKKVYDTLLEKGVPVDQSYFTKFDCLESNDDLELLFELLSSFKDVHQNHPCITALSLVANPDFQKISDSNKANYVYQSIVDTYKEYPNHDRVFDLWKNDGIHLNLLYPQFHGREHLNVRKWMNVINSNVESELLSFDNRVLLSLGGGGLSRNRFNYNAAFEYEDESHKKEIEDITREGLMLFNELFGFRSKSFAASASIRGDHLDKVLYDGGVLYHQLGQQFVPQEGGRLKIVNKFWGQTNAFGQIYWRRNATFEPSRNTHEDWVNNCLKDMQVAFRWGKPVVISSHRVNYSGGISEANRDRSLRLLKSLLQKGLKQWPDIEFINSEELGNILLESKKSE